MSKERALWGRMATSMNPGWKVALGKDLMPGEGTLGAAFNTFIYLIDASTLWIAAAAIRSSEMERAKQQLAQSGLPKGAAAGAAGMAILECGRQATPADHADAAQAIAAAVCAMTESQLYQKALSRTGSPIGHWMWLVYKLQSDGSPLGRPLFAQGGTGRGFMPIDSLKSSIARALLNDVATSDTSVGKQVSAGGGVDLHPELSALLEQALRDRERP